MEISAQLIADHIGGEIVGNPDVKVSTVAKIESGRPGAICFLANPKYEQFLYTCKASVILVNKSFEITQPVEATLIRVDNAYEAVASLLGLLNTLKKAKRGGRGWFSRCHIALSAKIGKGVWIGYSAYVGKRAKIGKGSQIYPQVYVGEDVEIGEDCIIYPGVKIYQGCRIGNRCIIHSNAVIGADGFGFAPTSDGSYKKIPQTGIVTLEDDVEIGANTTVDRATMGTTLVSKGVKIDNLVQVAHNVVVGENTVIAAQAGIAGSAKVGRQCMIGGQVGISGHITVGDDVKLAGGAGVMSNVTSGSTLMGSPALDHRLFLRAYAIFRGNGKKKE